MTIKKFSIMDTLRLNSSRFGYLQTFSGDPQDPPQDPPAGGGQPNPNDLNELLKDPAFKAQYEAKFKEQMGQRMKKFEGIDPEKYKKWQEDEQKRIDGELSDLQKAQKELDAMKLEKATLVTKEKSIAVKEYALDNGLNPKLVARLIDLDAIKQGDSGFEGIVEAVEAIKTDFPELFAGAEGGQGTPPAKPNFTPPPQKGNPPTPKDPYASGAAIAAQRHGKKE